ncbi:MAG: DUF2723 domain-containing protein [Chloroflexi bacterium]|nr:DUF2723 domain-containing protein [Chloroflexota bacterium]
MWVGLGAGLAGAVWGMALSRVVAEAGLVRSIWTSPWLVGVLTAGGALAFGATWRRTRVESAGLGGALPLCFPLLYLLGWVSSPLAGGLLLAVGLGAVVLPRLLERWRWLPLFVFGAITATVYLKTMLPSLGEADTFEFQVVVPLMRIAHPTGYPLYVLLSKLFTLLPIGTVAWRVNLASAAYATLAVLVLGVTLWRLTHRWHVAVASAAAFAFSATFWSQAIVAEVYSLHNLFLALLLWLLLVGLSSSSGRSPARIWAAICLISGLSMTNHLTTLLLGPAVVIALVWDRPAMTIGEWLRCGLLLCAGLAVYLWIPLRWPSLHEGSWMSLGEFIQYITGGQFHDAFRWDGWLDPVRWGIMWRLILEPYGWTGLLIGVTGLTALLWTNQRAAVLTGVVFLTYLAYGLNYYVPDIAVFVLPTHLILAVWMGCGVSSASDLLSKRLPRVGPDLSQIVPVIFLLMPLSRVWANLPMVDQSENRSRETFGRSVLSLPLEQHAVVLADVTRFAPMYYVQQIEGRRPDLELVLLGDEALYRAELADRLATRHPVYLARYLPRLDGLYLRSLGPLVAVSSTPWVGHSAPQNSLDVRFGDAIRLIGVDGVEKPDVTVTTPLSVTLHWEAVAPVVGDYHVRFQIIDSGGQVRWTSGDARPVTGMYPTNAWRVGEIVSDFHELALPATVCPGTYQLQVGLFPQYSEDGLSVGGATNPWFTLSDVQMIGPCDPPQLSHTVRWLFGERVWLTGYDLPTQASAGMPLDLTLDWTALTDSAAPVSLDGDWHLEALWRDESAPQLRMEDAGRLPSLGRTVRAHSGHTLVAPRREGRFVLSVGVVDQNGTALPAQCSWLGPRLTHCELAIVEVLAASSGLADFEGLIALAAAEVSSVSVHPGGIVPVTLHWRSLRAIDEDYTIFVQLIGPDGRLYGQVDAWPVQGSFPTSQWGSGEQVVDRYEVRLNTDAPPGRYQVQVGWYLLATMQRLAVLDGEGTAMGDATIIAEFELIP